MDLNSLTVDVAKVEEGDWVSQIPELGDIKLKVRGFANAGYRRMQTELFRAVPLSRRGDAAEQERINNQLLIETILIDWTGLTDNGKVIPYSKELAKKLLTDPQYQPFRDGVFWASHAVAESKSEVLEADGKNSQQP